jgi:colanic acid/amylovoran/stewartan biosynthesis glycosyltransferase WcaL/AmsK/CpsK
MAGSSAATRPEAEPKNLTHREGTVPRVGHLLDVYLAQTETFVYNQLIGLEPDEAVVLARNFECLGRFPLRIPIVRYETTPRAGLIARLARKLGREAGLYRRLVNAPEHSLIFVLRQHRVKLLHAHFGPNGYLAVPAARALRIPLVTSFYGYDASQLVREASWRKAYRLLFRAGSCFVVEGPAMKERLVSIGCPRDKIAIVPIGIDAARYHFRRRSRALADKPIRLLFVGRFVEKKGAKFAILALRDALASGIDARLDLVGDGPLREELGATVRVNALGERVRFLGMRKHDEVIALLDASDILLAPSVTGSDGDSEGGAPSSRRRATVRSSRSSWSGCAPTPSVGGLWERRGRRSSAADTHWKRSSRGCAGCTGGRGTRPVTWAGGERPPGCEARPSGMGVIGRRSATPRGAG